MGEGRPPGREHRRCDAVALVERPVAEIEQPSAFQPGQRQQPPGRKVRLDLGHAHDRRPVEHDLVQQRMPRLAAIVELLADACADLLVNLAGVDRGIDAAIDREQHLELRQVGLDRGLHVRILQLDGERGAVLAGGAVHLAERGRRRRLALERREALLPVRPEFGLHAAAHEGPAHRRRVRLQLREFGRIFRRHEIGHRREDLPNLHQRPLEAAERAGEIRRVLLLVERGAEQPRRSDLRRNASDIHADAGITGQAAGETVAF